MFIGIMTAAILVKNSDINSTDFSSGSDNESSCILNPISNISRPSTIFWDDFSEENETIWIKSGYGGPQGTQFSPEFVSISPISSTLNISSDLSSHRGGEYYTLNQYGYGRYWARIRTQNTIGTTMAFFLYRGPEPDEHHEIDIELVKDSAGTSAHFSTYIQRNQKSFIYLLPFDPGKEYHTYGFSWYPDRVAFYVDDCQVPVWTSYEYIPNKPTHLMFSNWVFKDLSNTQNPVNEKNILYIDWVRIDNL
ncbi:MAG: glycoside hydrolase family 16 protein [Euryarchaeota archaeon]|nr:glycoside hydrolase family 16 protein [Euryarchaeota archaeon]